MTNNDLDFRNSFFRLISPPPKTVWSRLTDAFGYLTQKESRGSGIQSYFPKIWTPKQLSTTELLDKLTERLMVYFLTMVLLCAISIVLVRRRFISNVLKNAIKSVVGFSSQYRKSFFIMGTILAALTLMIYFHTGLIDIL